MSENKLASNQQPNPGKKMFLLLALLFVLPFTIAMTMHMLDIRPSGKSNGHLIVPIVQLDMPAFKQISGEPFTSERWSKIWNVVMVDQGSCDETCELNVDKLNRVHRTLYKQEDRIQRLLLLDGDYEQGKMDALQKRFPHLIILPATDEQQRQFVDKIKAAASDSAIYLVDPLNNLMMDYPADIAPKALQSDLKRLLKNSWSG